MKPQIKIGKREIGQDHKPLIIAEIGINHSGSIKVAKALVDAAYKAGIEVVKHQTHIVDDEYSEESKLIIPVHSSSSIYEIMESCSLKEHEEWELMKYVEEKGMIFISTPFSKKALERLIEFNVPAIKIGSGECNNIPLIGLIAATGKPVIMSTGMNNLESIGRSIKILSSASSDIAILHTTNLYPTPHSAVRLRAMVDMHNRFPEYVYGLSDHTQDNISSLGAIALGASIIEKHFTDTRARKGPDIACSMSAKEAEELKANAIKMQLCLGLEYKKEPHPEEHETARFAFASVVAMRKIPKGKILTNADIWVKRPGTGEIGADKYFDVLGTKTNYEIENGKQLKWKDIS